MLRHTVRATRVAIGAILVLLGIVLSLPLVPGPGLLLVFGGLSVLSYEFHWARRLRDRLRAVFHRATERVHG